MVRYERVDLASCQKYLGRPDDPDEVILDGWWRDVLAASCEDRFVHDDAWHNPPGLTKYLGCPRGTLGRAVEENLLHEQEPSYRLDNRLFEAAAAMVEDAASARRAIEDERDARVVALKRAWESGPAP